MKNISRIVIFSLLILLATFLVSCGSKTVEQSPTTAPNSPPTGTQDTTKQESVAANGNNIKFKLEGGKDAFSLKLMTDGANLVDASDRELARINNDKEKFKIKDAADKILGYVVSKDGDWKIENADQTKELYVLRQQNDGDYKLEDGGNKEIYRIKKRNYGFEIETPTKQSLYKVKSKDSKISLKNASEQTVLYTKSGFAPVAIACFGFDVLSREQKAALAYAVNLAGGK